MSRAPRRNPAPLAALAFAGAMSAALPLDADLWIHLNTGRFLAETGRLPVPDPFSYGAGGAVWTAHEWLAEWLIYQLVSQAGIWAAAGAFGIVSALTWLVVERSLVGHGVRPWIRATAVVVGSLAAASFGGIRPLQLGLLAAALVAGMVLRHRRTGSPVIWLLPGVFLFWANVHASFVIGFAVILGALGDIWWRRLGLPSPRENLTLRVRAFGAAAIISAAAIFINPSGPGLWLHPFWQATVPARQFNSDWNPPVPLSPTWWASVLLLGGVALTLLLRRMRVSPVFLILTVALLAVGFNARKTMAFSAVVAPMLLADPLMRLAPGKLRLPEGAFRALAGLGIVAAMLLGAVLAPKSLDGATVTPMPYGARAYLDDLRPPRIWNTYHWGGFLTWELWPDSRVFIDGRYDLFVGRPLDDYLSVLAMGPAWRETLAKGDPQAVVVQARSALALALQDEANWRMAYLDEVAAVFIRPDCC